MSLPLDILIKDPGLVAALEELAWRKWQLECIQAEKEQIALAAQGQETRAVDGLGEVTARVHATAHFDMIRQYGHGCWGDQSFNKHFLGKNPECKVKSTGTRPQIQCGWERNVRESKVYANG